MAVVDKAEEGKYFNPHDARIGGVLCDQCNEPLKWNEFTIDSNHAMSAEHCGKKYFLKEENNYHLIIFEGFSESNES